MDFAVGPKARALAKSVAERVVFVQLRDSDTWFRAFQVQLQQTGLPFKTRIFHRSCRRPYPSIIGIKNRNAKSPLVLNIGNSKQKSRVFLLFLDFVFIVSTLQLDPSSSGIFHFFVTQEKRYIDDPTINLPTCNQMYLGNHSYTGFTCNHISNHSKFQLLSNAA